MAPVPETGKETVEQVVVGAVNLNAIVACLFGPLRTLGKNLNKFVDFRDGKLFAWNPGIAGKFIFLYSGDSHPFRIAHAFVFHQPGPRVHVLDKYRTVMSMDLIYHSTMIGDTTVIMKTKSFENGMGAAGPLHTAALCNDKPDSAFCEGRIVRRLPIGRVSIGIIACACGGLYDAILYPKTADISRFHKFFKGRSACHCYGPPIIFVWSMHRAPRFRRRCYQLVAHIACQPFFSSPFMLFLYS